MKDSRFYKQAELMVRLLPFVRGEKEFALKGGTAINFFVRDMPRLSVDIDLTYLKVEPRAPSLKAIGKSLDHLAKAVRRVLPQSAVQTTILKESKEIYKVNVVEAGTYVKIEPNTVIRGTVFPSEIRHLSPKASELFEASGTINTLSVADLYGGKICAALDRQHPRDLFDIKVLFENEGITEEIRKAFIVYLVGHDRTMHELIDPVRKNVIEAFESDFRGMATTTVKYEELIQAREQLIKVLNQNLANKERQFLLSFKMGEPAWNLLGLDGVEKLPAIQWKLMNIKKMTKKKHEELTGKLKRKLGL